MRIWLIAILAALCAFAPAAAHAQRSITVETIESSTPNGKPAWSLVINGDVVARLAKPTLLGGIERSPQRGITLAAAVLAEAYRAGRAELAVVSDSSGRDYTLQVNGRPLLVASDMEGKAWGATPAELAATWQHNILAALASSGNALPAEPAVPHQRSEVQPPRQQPRRAEPEPTPADPLPAVAQDGGLLLEDEGPAAVKSSPPRQQPREPAAKPQPKATSPAKTAAPPKTNAAQPGTQVSTLSSLDIRGGQRAYEPPSRQSIAPLETPPQHTVIVTGDNPSPALVKAAADAAIRSAAGLADTDTITWRPMDEKFLLPALRPGTKLSLPAVYKVNGGTELRPVTLSLENRAIPPARETVTFFSNAPENIRREQLLYYASLPPGQAARLVYHHQNQAAGKLRFVARVVNPEGRPLALHVTPGETPPNINTFFVGFKSAESFWENLGSGNGYVLRVPAGGQAWLVGQMLDPGYTASGYWRLSNVSDGALRIETLALDPATATPKGAWPSAAGASAGVYPQPYITTQHEYVASAGKPWLYLRLGEEAPGSHTDESVHYGCYGVTHTYEITLRNASSELPALVFIVLRGSGGEVKGQFYIDDQYIATPLVRGGEEQMLQEVPLPPGAVKTVRIKAMALNGSFYPASIILREERVTIKY